MGVYHLSTKFLKTLKTLGECPKRNKLCKKLFLIFLKSHWKQIKCFTILLLTYQIYLNVQGAAKKVAPYKFFAVFSTTISNFNLKFYSFVNFAKTLYI